MRRTQPSSPPRRSLWIALLEDDIHPLAARGVLLLLGGTGILLGLGSFHIVQTPLSTYTLIRKSDFSFQEPYVSMGAILAQPWEEALAQYPLVIRALQRDGFLPRDAAMREQGRRQEVEQQIEEAFATGQLLIEQQREKMEQVEQD